MEGVEVLASDEWRYYGCGSTFVLSHGRRVPLPTTIASAKRIFERYQAQLGRPLNFVILVEPDATPMSAEVRRGVGKMQESLDTEHVRCQAIGVLGKGFVASHFMSFASRVFLRFRRSPFPTGVLATVSDVAAWISRHDPEVDPQTLERRLEEIRADAIAHWTSSAEV